MPEECNPTNDEIEIIDSEWIQVKGRIQKIKEQPTSNKKYISIMLNEISDHCQEN